MLRAQRSAQRSDWRLFAENHLLDNVADDAVETEAHKPYLGFILQLNNREAAVAGFDTYRATSFSEVNGAPREINRRFWCAFAAYTPDFWCDAEVLEERRDIA